MATKKNISATPTRVFKKKSTKPTAAQMKRFDDKLADLRHLFGWGLSDAQTDLSRICYGDVTGQMEPVIATAMAAMKESPMYALLVKDFQQLSGDFNLLCLCSRMYLAGKMSPARIDVAVFDAANPPITPDKL
ncbi:hypothetical protein [Granulicella sp. L60]|uniref:hypothetical protein n=1 Tax=Granulicella sp. L60 TaxID=1641866 RepID=UPI00131A943D|nr:hypothetical protein [Granulicella sp. L60]